jgi:predicted transposase YbfD/YdcC
METAGRLRLAAVFVSIEDPRQSAKVRYGLVELLVVAVNAVLVGADTFVEIELWAEEKLEWLRGYLRLAHGIPSHDTFGRIFGLIDPEQFESAFRRWVSSVLPALGAEIVAIDGKTGVPGDRSSSLGWKTIRRSGGVDATALHLVSAFAAGAGLVLGQRATAEKSNEITAIPELLSTLALSGCTVTIDAMGTQTSIAEAIQERGADYVLAVKDNQPKLAESIEDFWKSFRAHPAIYTPHTSTESVEKNHGRSNEKEASKREESSLPLPTATEPNSWDSNDLHAIALPSPPSIAPLSSVLRCVPIRSQSAHPNRCPDAAPR